MPMRRVLSVAVAGLLAQGASGLYADEAGKLDWHRQNMGRFVSAVFDGRGGLTVVGEASTLASVDSHTGELAWRHVLPPQDTILASFAPSARSASTATVSSGGRIVRLWSPVDGGLLWEAFLGHEASAAGAGAESPESTDGDAFVSAGVVLTDRGHVVVLGAGGIHVLSAVSGAVLAQWWCDPTREPDLAALVGSNVQVTFTSLRLVPGGGGTLLAGGWSSKKGVTGKAEELVMAEINPAERLVTFKAAKVGKLGVNPASGITLSLTHGGGGADKRELVVVGLCGGGSSLAIFSPSSNSPSAIDAPLPASAVGSSSRSLAVVGLSDLTGTNGGVLELKRGDGGSVAVTLSSGRTNTVSVVGGVEGATEAWSCDAAAASGGCALAGGSSPTGKTYVASASMRLGKGDNTASKLVVSVVEVTPWGDWTDHTVDTFETDQLSSLGQGTPGVVQAAFLEARDGGRFRALVVNEDESAMMVGKGGVEWVREEALSAVDQVAFVDSSKDELAILAASGQKVEHHVPVWQERLRLHRLELTSYVGKAVEAITGLRLPGAEILEEADTAHSAFGLKKLAVCTTKAGKLYAVDMADGSIAWSLFYPSWARNAKTHIFATRPKGALGYNPEVVFVALGENSAIVSRLDALTGAETSREELRRKVASVVPLGVKDDEERSVMMLVDSDERVHFVPSSAAGSSAVRDMLPQLFYHHLSESGLESFMVVPPSGDEEVDGVGSLPVASVPFYPTRSKVVATAYPDRRDGVPTPAHTLGDDSLLIKYINPRMFAFATLTPVGGGAGAGGDAGKLNGVGQELTVTLVDYVSGRLLHRIAHKGAAEPVHMQVSESWVVYSYWNAVAHRTEMSTLSLYEGMIDKYGLSPFNRPEWKEEFSSFESRVPIVLQKTFIFPSSIAALGITLTQHGITSKNILVGTALGQVMSLDRRFLDPRRPDEEPSKTEKEEKLIQYQPYLPIVATQVLSYYKVIERVNRVLTEPTGLESTSLVLALGLDLFGARVAPSKTYDMLDPNFNYALLVLVLGAMTAAVLVAGHFASKKRLQDQWA